MVRGGVVVVVVTALNREPNLKLRKKGNTIARGEPPLWRFAPLSRLAALTTAASCLSRALAARTFRYLRPAKTRTGRRTTGTPIAVLIRNFDQRSRDYGNLRDTYRPGHADFTFDAKYGVRDYRGGGRSSARETAMRVAAGAIARRILSQRIKIRGAVVQMGDHEG